MCCIKTNAETLNVIAERAVIGAALDVGLTSLSTALVQKRLLAAPFRR